MKLNTYKITNLTGSLGKRDIKYNTILDITYMESMMKKTIQINPNESLYLQIPSLPLSVQTLRAKKLISVIEIAKTELKDIMFEHNKPINTSTINILKETTENTDSELIKAEKKRANKKNHNEDINI